MAEEFWNDTPMPEIVVTKDSDNNSDRKLKRLISAMVSFDGSERLAIKEVRQRIGK